MPVSIIVSPPPILKLRIVQRPKFKLRIGTGGGGGGAGTITEITSLDNSVVIANPTGPSVDLSVPASAPLTHATTHQNGGADEITVLGLSGLLADPQTPLAHKTSHQDGGADEILVTGLSGLLVDPQKIEIAKAGTLIGTRKRINLIDGSGVTFTVADNPGSDRVDVTAAAEPFDPWFFFNKAPASPNTDDDEFTSGSLNARWTAVKQGTWIAATIAGTVSRAGPAAGAVNLTPNYRGTHLAWQGADGGIIRTFTMPAVLQIRFRVAANGNSASGTAGPFASLYCGGYSGGAPDMTTNYVRHGWTNNQPTANTKIWNAVSLSSGGNVSVPGQNMWGMTDDLEFILVIEAGAGTSFARWFVRSGPSPHFITSRTINGIGVGATSYIYLRFINISPSGDPNGGAQSALGLCDYIRIRTDGDIEAY